MARKKPLTIALAKKIAKRTYKGDPLTNILKEEGYGYNAFRKVIDENGIDYQRNRGKVAVTYTREIAMAVKKRAIKGEFVSYICAELGLDYKNFSRFCRRNDIKMLNKKQLKENNQRRRTGPGQKTTLTKSEIKKIRATVNKGSTLSKELIKFKVSIQTYNDSAQEYGIKVFNS